MKILSDAESAGLAEGINVHNLDVYNLNSGSYFHREEGYDQESLSGRRGSSKANNRNLLLM